MQHYRQFTESLLNAAHGHKSCVLLDESNGCRGECLAGISVYQRREFSEPQCHGFQEGFYVISGSGLALVGNEDFSIEEGMTFLVPVGVRHTLKCAPNCDSVKVFWFHSA